MAVGNEKLPKRRRVVRAWELGTGSRKETTLCKEGKISKRKDGKTYDLCIRGSKIPNATACKGDFFMLTPEGELDIVGSLYFRNNYEQIATGKWRMCDMRAKDNLQS